MFHLSISQWERDFRKHLHLAPRQLQPGSPWGADRMALNYRAALVKQLPLISTSSLPEMTSAPLGLQVFTMSVNPDTPLNDKREKSSFLCLCLWHIRKEDGTTSIQARARHSRYYDPTFSTACSFAKGISEIP